MLCPTHGSTAARLPAATSHAVSPTALTVHRIWKPKPPRANGPIHPSMGQRPMIEGPRNKGLKARPTSIPHIPLIILNPVFVEKCPVLILKRLCPVMLLLVVDVVTQGFEIGRPHRKSPIASLPRKISEFVHLSLQPFGGGRFGRFHQLGQSEGVRQPNGEMHMIACAPTRWHSQSALRTTVARYAWSLGRTAASRQEMRFFVLKTRWTRTNARDWGMS